MFAKSKIVRVAFWAFLAAASLPLVNGFSAQAKAEEIVRIRPIVRRVAVTPVAPVVSVTPVVPVVRVAPIVRVGPVYPRAIYRPWYRRWYR